MTAEDRSEELREAARHRGLKLVKSRRRKPGVGDFGHFGLTDADGKKLLGFGKDGLTATADDIATYLRKDAAATWAESARTTLGRAKKKPAPKLAPLEATPAPEPEPPPAEEPQPVERPLMMRKATAGDAAVIAALIDADQGKIAALLRRKPSVLVAERTDIVGCIAWHRIPTMRHGLIGRLTLIFVSDDERRRGTGTALVQTARTELAKQGCTLVEAMSDIEIGNAHGFFRALGFRQASYRFTIG